MGWVERWWGEDALWCFLPCVAPFLACPTAMTPTLRLPASPLPLAMSTPCVVTHVQVLAEEGGGTTTEVEECDEDEEALCPEGAEEEEEEVDEEGAEADMEVEEEARKEAEVLQALEVVRQVRGEGGMEGEGDGGRGWGTGGAATGEVGRGDDGWGRRKGSR